MAFVGIAMSVRMPLASPPATSLQKCATTHDGAVSLLLTMMMLTR